MPAAEDSGRKGTNMTGAGRSMGALPFQSGASMADAKRWRTGLAQQPQPGVAPATKPTPQPTGPRTPQPGVPAPDTADRLPRFTPALPATVWWLGVHGGAGESTLATLAHGSRPAEHAWPVPDTPGPASRVVLVARTNWAGLTAAQRAATEWASGALDPVELAGLVLIPDAPGRLPKPLRDLQQLIAGGVPQVWALPWVDAWRFGPVNPAAPLPKEFHVLLTDLHLSPSGTAHN